MTGITDLALAPWRAGRMLLTAADDLHALAERARRDPDPIEEARERLDLLLAELRRLLELLDPLQGLTLRLTATVGMVDHTGRALDARGAELLDATRALDARGSALLVTGEELVEVGNEATTLLRAVRAALPRLLEGVDAVDHLEDAVESVAETVEPLAGAAERVGRVTSRLSRHKDEPVPAA